MQPDPAQRPSLSQALADPFLTELSCSQAKSDMRRHLPTYCQQTDFLPVLSRGAAVQSHAAVFFVEDHEDCGIPGKTNAAPAKSPLPAATTPPLSSGSLVAPTHTDTQETDLHKPQRRAMFDIAVGARGVSDTLQTQKPSPPPAHTNSYRYCRPQGQHRFSAPVTFETSPHHAQGIVDVLLCPGSLLCC